MDEARQTYGVSWIQPSNANHTLREAQQAEMQLQLFGEWRRSGFSDARDIVYALEQAQRAENLLKILHSRRGCGVSDPRDMAYAYLGILGPHLHDKHKDLIRVDYAKSFCDLYMDLALYSIRSRRGFGFLSHVEDIHSALRQKGLASWLPDWTSPHKALSVKSWNEQFMVPSIDLVHIGLKSAAVLGCIGTKLGVISVILDSMPPKVDFATLHEQVREKEIAYKTLRDLPLHWLEEQYSFTLAKKEGRNQSPLPKLGINEYGFDLLKPLFRNLLQSPFNSLPPTIRYKNDEATIFGSFNLLDYLIVGMTDIHGSGCFPDKKIAFLGDQRLVLAPQSAEVGDEICCFNTSPVPYVLRDLRYITKDKTESLGNTEVGEEQ